LASLFLGTCLRATNERREAKRNETDSHMTLHKTTP
jgi:hypothetical protein